MKRRTFFLLFLLALILPNAGHAQGEATAIDSLIIEMWPDYDRPSVLTLLTGTLPADTSLPASVTLPIPEKAKINAVARIDSADGTMKDDIVSSATPGGITFVTPDLGFRVEYYFPYAIDENRRSFDFAWSAALSVRRFQLKVQQPVSASSFSTEPAATNSYQAEDGLTYHAFPVQAVPAGQSVSVHVDYTTITPGLSVESLAAPDTRAEESGSPVPSRANTGIDWPLVAVVVMGIILMVFIAWQIVTRRRTSSRPTPHRTGTKKGAHARFCSNCGNPTDQDDRFCGKCGSALEKK